jgi:hypothetical protein
MSEQQASRSPIVGSEVDEGQQLAQEIAEAPERLRRRLDVAQVLDGMRKGVLIELRITRPRFTVAIAGKKKNSTEMPGLEKLGLMLSEEAQRVLYDDFTLGRHSLLPRQWQEELNVAETAARRCLAEHSIKTHWGAFLPAASYQRWSEANEGYKERFLALKDRILDGYDEMRATVETDYRRLAEDAWAHMTFGRVALQAHNGAVSTAMMADLSEKLSEQQAHDQFVTQYMSVIENLMPTQEELADAFEYEHDLSYIPLPAHLANASTQPSREQIVQEATAQAELEVIQARREAELQVIQSATEAEAAMHRDVMENAKKQKEQLTTEFYADVVEYINARIAAVCAKTRESLEKNGKNLRGPNAESLRDLVTMMENLNIVGDQHIEEQIEKLREVLPTRWSERSKTARIDRIDTSRIEAVIREMEEDAEQVLLELDLGQAPRGRRAQSLTLGEGLIPEEPRRTARSKPSVLPVDLASSRRKRKKA